MILGLDHVQLAMPVGGEGRARKFYSGALELTEVPKPVDMAARGGCWFESGSARIHLGIESDFRPAKKAHPALLVENLNEVRERLARHGVAFTEGGALEGYIRGDVHDPFGNRIELMQKL